MNYLFLGDDSFAKDVRIADIKKKHLPSSDTLSFDFETLDAHKLSPSQLKKTLIALPAIAHQRVVIVRAIEKLSKQNKELIVEFLEQKHAHLILIFDGNKGFEKNSFVKKIRPYVKLEICGGAKEINVFDMTNALSAKNESQALKILSELFIKGDHPLQIMGALVWFWGKCRQRLSAENFKKGLLVLQEADFNIKRSRINSEYAVEFVVVKLCSLLV